MKLTVQKEVLETFQPTIGVLYVEGIDNSKAVPEIGALLDEAAETIRKDLAQFESPSKHPFIAAWRQTYKKFGSDPHEYRCSAEALARRVLKGDRLPRINTMVDLYNLVSLKYVLPVGGEDTDAIVGDLQLAFADGNEEFMRIGGVENEPPKVGEVVYKDSAGVVCRRWNWREADRTKLRETTKNAIVVVDAVPPTARALVEEATNELAELISRYCGGTSRVEIIDIGAV